MSHLGQGNHFSFFQGGGNILTDYLGGQNMKKQNTKNHYFSKSGGGAFAHPTK